MHSVPGEVSTPAQQLAHKILHCHFIGIMLALQILKKKKGPDKLVSDGVRFGLQGGCGSSVHLHFVMVCVVCMLVCGHRLSWRSTTSDLTLSSLIAHPCGVHPASKTSEVLLLHDNNAGHSALHSPQRPSACSPDLTPVDHHRL